jgi:hypothetical protein
MPSTSDAAGYFGVVLEDDSRQPMAGDGREVEVPAKRRRGRPRSIVFEYFQREKEDDSFVNRCKFCSFVSRDRSFNATYLSRHTITACPAAPPDVVERLKQARSSASHGSKKQATVVSQAEIHSSPLQLASAAEPDRNTPLFSTVESVGESPVKTPALPFVQASPVQRLSSPSRSKWARSREAPAEVSRSGTLPIPAPSVLLSNPFVVQTGTSDCVGRQSGNPAAATGSRHEQVGTGEQRRSYPSFPRGSRGIRLHESLQHLQDGVQSARQHSSDIQRRSESLTKRLHSQTLPHDAFEGTTFQNVGKHPQRTLGAEGTIAQGHERDAIEWSPSPWRATPLVQSDEVTPGLPASRQRSNPQSVARSRLPFLPSLSDMEPEKLRILSTPADVVTGYGQLSRAESLPEKRIQSHFPRRAEEERRRLVHRCTGAVDTALSTAETSTLLCLGKSSRVPVDSIQTGTELDKLGLHAGSYDGVCSALAMDPNERLVFLGAEDCLLQVQVTSFLASCTGRHLSGGSFCAVLFACDPQDAAIAAFSEAQSQFRNVFFVVDVAHAADELCYRMAQESASAAQYTRYIHVIARFMATNDLLSDMESLEAVIHLPERTRFSAVVQAMLDIVAHKQTLLNALSHLQSASSSASDHGIAIFQFAGTLTGLLSSDAFIRSLYRTAKFLEPLYRLVALYDGCPRAPKRGFHNVERDCISAARLLDQSPSGEMQVTNHVAIARRTSLSLLGDKSAAVQVGTVAGNAAILATHLDPQYSEPAGAMGTVREHRLYNALHVACNGSGLSVDDAWGQMQRFIYQKESMFSREALSAAVAPPKWWARFGRASCPDLCRIALKILTIPASAGTTARHVAAVTAQDPRLRGAAMRRDPATRDHVFCMWNARLSKMKDDALLTVGSPLDSPLSVASQLFAEP